MKCRVVVMFLRVVRLEQGPPQIFSVLFLVSGQGAPDSPRSQPTLPERGQFCGLVCAFDRVRTFGPWASERAGDATATDPIVFARRELVPISETFAHRSRKGPRIGVQARYEAAWFGCRSPRTQQRDPARPNYLGVVFLWRKWSASTENIVSPQAFAG